MSRKPRTAFDWFMDELGRWPWWAALALAAIFFVTFEYAFPWLTARQVAHAATTQDSIPGLLWGPLGPYLARVGAPAIMFLWVLSAYGRRAVQWILK